MSGSIFDNYNNAPPTDTDKNVLNLIFGDKTCVDDPITKFFWYFGFAIIATLIFFVLISAPVNNYINGYVKSDGISIALKVLIFFILILLIDWLFTSWRQSKPICGQNKP